MKFAIEKIEDNIVLLENIEDGDMLKVNISDFPFKVKEKDIIRLENGEYILDIKEKEERLKRIRKKMESLKNKK